MDVIVLYIFEEYVLRDEFWERRKKSWYTKISIDAFI